MAKKKQDTPELIHDVNKDLEEAIVKAGVQYTRLAENLSNKYIECQSTGLPQLDAVLHPTKKGLPRGRDIEISSRTAESCKTSLALQIAGAWQRAGLRTAFIDVENTLDVEFLDMNKIVYTTDNPEVPAMLILKHDLQVSDREDGIVSAENIFNDIKKLSNIVDLIIVDSLAAMELHSNLDKMADENNKMGGIAKNLSEFLKKNVNKRATIIWINQMRMSMGYSPTGSPLHVTPCGKAMEFYASIRLQLSMIEKLKLNDTDPPFGMKIQSHITKNKIAPPFRQCNLTYIFNEGFSDIHDYVEMGVQIGAIKKNKGWYTIGEKQANGLKNLVNLLKTDQEAFDQVKAAVNGETIEDEPAKAS